MKKNFNIILAFMIGCIALGFTSCKSDMDSNPVFQKPTTFVLNTPAAAAGLYDLQNTETVALSWSQPDYGYAAVATYDVEVSTDAAFAQDKVYTIPGFTSCRSEIKASELAVGLCTISGVQGEDDAVLNTPVKMYVRVKASIPLVGEESVIYSNTIELAKVKFYYALPDLVLPENMFMIGTFCDWSWSKSAKMVKVNGKPGMWWCIRYVGGGDGNGIKFNTNDDWDGGQFGLDGITKGDKIACGEFSQDGDGNLIIENAGWYIFAMETTIDGRNYVNTLNVFPADVYVYGAANGGIWNSDPAWKFSVPADADGWFTSPALVADGEVRMCINPGWGADWWGLEFTLKDNETIVYRENDNIADNWEKDKGSEYSVQGAPGKVVKLNFAKGTGFIE